MLIITRFRRDCRILSSRGFIVGHCLFIEIPSASNMLIRSRFQQDHQFFTHPVEGNVLVSGLFSCERLTTDNQQPALFRHYKNFIPLRTLRVCEGPSPLCFYT